MAPPHWLDLPLRVVLASALVMPGLTGAAPLTEAQAHAVSGGRASLTCPLLSGGRIDARTETVRGRVVLQPGSREIAGTLVADVRDIDAGAVGRTAQVRENLLEVDRGQGYASVVLTDLVLDAPLTGDVRGGFRGSLTMHGTTRAVTGTLALQRRGQGLEMRLHVDLEMDAFGIARIDYPGVRLTGGMALDLRLTLQPTSAEASQDPPR